MMFGGSNLRCGVVCVAYPRYKFQLSNHPTGAIAEQTYSRKQAILGCRGLDNQRKTQAGSGKKILGP